MSNYVLQYPNGELHLPEQPATVGDAGLDISSLLKDTGHVTLDSGFMNTASCKSAITYIDGDAGIEHRGTVVAVEAVVALGVTNHLGGYRPRRGDLAESLDVVDRDSAANEPPQPIVERLHRDFAAAFADPRMKARFPDLGGSDFQSTPAEFGRFLADEVEKWAKVIKTQNIKAE